MLPLFLLADSRLPSGGHGHSGGVEALVDRGLVRSVDDLALFLDGRIRTGGRVVAAAAAAACALASADPDCGGGQQGAAACTERQQRRPAGTPDRATPGAPDWARWDAAVSART